MAPLALKSRRISSRSCSTESGCAATVPIVTGRIVGGHRSWQQSAHFSQLRLVGFSWVEFGCLCERGQGIHAHRKEWSQEKAHGDGDPYIGSCMSHASKKFGPWDPRVVFVGLGVYESPQVFGRIALGSRPQANRLREPRGEESKPSAARHRLFWCLLAQQQQGAAAVEG